MSDDGAGHATTGNRLFEDIALGEEFLFRRTVAPNDLYIFAHASGDLNPLSLPSADGDGDPTTPAIAPAMWLASLPAAVFGMVLPGPGTTYRAQYVTFHVAAEVGDRLTVSVKVVEKRAPRLIVCAFRINRADGVLLADGQAELLAPARRLAFDAIDAPKLIVETHDRMDRLIAACEGLQPLPAAIVCPEEAEVLRGALAAARHGLIAPILVGDPARIAAAARQAGVKIEAYQIEPASGEAQAAARAVALVHEGRARALMKGHLHTEALLAPVLKTDGGLKTGRRVSHVFVLDVPGHDGLLFVTDAAINIAPNLEAKVDIVQNAIHLALALGIERPKVGVLSAVETVTPKIPSSIDAALLAKMAERGQIRGGIVDGPLAMDNAVDVEAARTKGIRSLVAGRADILVVPNLETGNILAKELVFLSGAEAAGLVVGARVPIMLTSRADGEKARLASAAVAVLHAHYLSTGHSRMADIPGGAA